MSIFHAFLTVLADFQYLFITQVRSGQVGRYIICNFIVPIVGANKSINIIMDDYCDIFPKQTALDYRKMPFSSRN